jgi:5'(3')-deoxyribonucleotidase
MEKGQGLRFNKGKTRHDLIPAFAQEQYAKVLTKGAEKYAERNWEKGMAWSKIISSLERHLQAIKSGEDYDPETGLLHSAHVMCNAAFLTEYYKIYPQGDDRPHNYLSNAKIGLDIDEVLCDWLGGWTKYWNIENVPSSWFFDRDIIKKFKSMEKNNTIEKFYLDLKPLIKPEDIPFEPHCYITSRMVDTKITEQWLDKHGFPAAKVYTVPMGHSKVEVAKESGIDIFVDDRFENFAELNKNNICCFLYDQPHNRRYNVGFKRIKHLKDLM